MSEFNIPQYGLSNPNRQMPGFQIPQFDMGGTQYNPLFTNNGGGFETLGAGWDQGLDPNTFQQKPAGFDLGWNVPTVGLGLYGLNTLGNLWSSFQANKIAKDQLAWAKEFGNANLNNSIKQYNTQLTDRATTRMASNGWSPDQVATYTDQNKVSR